MPETFMDFIGMVSRAEFDFGGLGEFFRGLIDAFLQNETISIVVGAVSDFLAGISAFLPYILIALSLVLCFFGKKLLPVLKFFGFFVVGYVCSVYWLAPLLNGVFPTLLAWIPGVVVGFIAAILGRYLYWLALALVAGYPIYMICYNALYLPFLEGLTKENWMISLIVAAVVVVMVFILKKYVEMLGTALLGSFLAVLAVKSGIWDFYNFDWLYYTALGVVAFLGLLVQFKTRKRYY